MEISYDGSLEGLFGILEAVRRGAPLPDRIRRAVPFPGEAPFRREGPERRMKPAEAVQGDLFGNGGPGDPAGVPLPAVSSCTRGARAAGAFLPGAGFRAAEDLYEVSAAAYGDMVYAWMTEFPIETEIISFASRILETALRAGGGPEKPAAALSREARTAADRVRSDRLDPAVRTTLEAAFKARRDVHRLLGLLRFRVGEPGVPVARCAPDHFVLPAMARHFTLRFGERPWAIADERRAVALIRLPPEEAGLCPHDPDHPWFRDGAAAPGDGWESLWKRYFRAINNESRYNPDLQRRFMPVRYWKYLPEVEEALPCKKDSRGG